MDEEFKKQLRLERIRQVIENGTYIKYKGGGRNVQIIPSFYGNARYAYYKNNVGFSFKDITKEDILALRDKEKKEQYARILNHLLDDDNVNHQYFFFNGKTDEECLIILYRYYTLSKLKEYKINTEKFDEYTIDELEEMIDEHSRQVAKYWAEKKLEEQKIKEQEEEKKLAEVNETKTLIGSIKKFFK